MNYYSKLELLILDLYQLPPWLTHKEINKYKKEYKIMKVTGMIHSKKEIGEAILLKKVGDNDYLFKVNDIICHGIYNPFAGIYYIDDIYAIEK